MLNRRVKGKVNDFICLELRPGSGFEDDRGFWEVFASTLYRFSRCCFEVLWDGRFISFYLLVPCGVVDHVVNVLKPVVRGEVVVGKPINLRVFLGSGFRVWEGRLSRPFYVPLFKLSEKESGNYADVYVPALASTEPPSVLQICLSPDPGALGVIGDFVYEKSTSRATSFSKILVNELSSLLSMPDTSPHYEARYAYLRDHYYARYGRNVFEDELLNQAKKKMSMPLFAVSIRFASRNSHDVHRISAAFVFPLNQVLFHEGKVEDFIERRVRKIGWLFKDKKLIVLSPKELSSILTLPSENILPTLPVKVGVALLEPPPEIPKATSLEEARVNEMLALGLWEPRGTYHGVKLSDFLRTHTAIFGSTGTGKSTELKWLFKYIVEDLGYGVCLVDPHGDLAYEVLKLVPEDRVDDLVYFDPLTAFEKRYRRVVKINFLEWKTPWEKGRVAEDFITALKRLFGGSSWGPRLEHILRNLVLTLVDQPPGTVSVLDLYNLLVDDVRRDELVSRVRDPIVRHFWESEFPILPKEAIASVVNKLSPLVTSRILRPIFSAKTSTIDLRKIMDGGKIMVVNIGEYRVSGNLQAFLGTLLVGRLFTAAVQREEITPKLRTPFFIIVDEAHSFITPVITKILAETRKYRVFLILATQYPQQLPRNIRIAVYENAGNLMVFRVGKETARELKKLFEPHLSEGDLVNLQNYWFTVRVYINGRVTRPFHLKNIYIPVKLEGSNPFTEDPVIVSRIRRSLEKYGVGAEEEAPRYHVPVTPIEWNVLLRVREGEVPLRELDPDVVELLCEKGYLEKFRKGKTYYVKLTSYGEKLLTFNPHGGPLHRRLVLMVVEKLLGEGYYVIVDEEGCEAVPDVVAIKPGGPEKWSNVIECFEVETYPDKSLTREKIMWFKDKAKRNNCSSLTIVVPEEYVELVRKRLDEVKVGFNVLGLRVSVEFVDWLYEKMLGEGIPGAIDRDGKIYLTRETVEAYHRETGREISLSDASRLVHGVYRTLRVHGRVVRVVELPPHFSARKEE